MSCESSCGLASLAARRLELVLVWAARIPLGADCRNGMSPCIRWARAGRDERSRWPVLKVAISRLKVDF